MQENMAAVKPSRDREEIKDEIKKTKKIN